MPSVAKGALDESIDPVTFSVIRSRFEAIGEEMTLALERTAWSSVLSLARDYSCMMYDAHPEGPRQITMAESLPIHCNNIRELLMEVVKSFDGDFSDGDMILVNDPYAGNTHLPDVVTVAPVFVDGKLTFWSVARGHQIDIGAMEPSSVVPSATSIYQEGLIIPPVKIIAKGVEQRDIFRLYLANVRYREAMNGDLRAQLGCVGVARRQLVALCQKYGRDVVLRYVEALMDYADRRATEQFKSFPNGSYEGVTWLDNDGKGKENVVIKAKVTIKDGHIHVDYSGSDPQSAGSANNTYATMKAATTIPFICYIGADIPQNHGVLKHITAEAEPGSVCLAKFPAAISQSTQGPSERIQEAISIAMAQAIPDLVPAGSPHLTNIINFNGVYPETGVAWGCMVFNGGAGQGAMKNTDGWPLFYGLSALGGLLSGSVEQVEMMHALVIEEMEVETDSMGCGQWIGGPGVRTRYRSTGADMEAFSVGDGFRNPAYGVMGGLASPGGGIFIEHRNGSRTFTSSAGQTLIRAGEKMHSISPGGGGWGSPLDRDPEMVRRNLRDGIISKAAATDIFGVVCRDDRDLTVDAEATRRRRADLAKTVKRTLIVPTGPGECKWAENRMKKGDRFIENPTISENFNRTSGAGA